MRNNKLIYGIGLLCLAAVIFYIGADLSSTSFFRRGGKASEANASDSLSISGIRSLSSDCDCDIEIIPSEIEKVVMYYDKKHHENKSEFVNNALQISFNSERNNFLFFEKSSKIKIKVYCKSLKTITQSGVGDVDTKGLLTSDTLTLTNEGVGDMKLEIKTSNLTVSNVGVGDVKLKGEAMAVSLINEGTGDVDAKNLNSKTAKVINSGVGDVDVNATDTLNLSNSGVGDINYSGAAVVSSTISEGVGSIHKK